MAASRMQKNGLLSRGPVSRPLVPIFFFLAEIYFNTSFSPLPYGPFIAKERPFSGTVGFERVPTSPLSIDTPPFPTTPFHKVSLRIPISPDQFSADFVVFNTSLPPLMRPSDETWGLPSLVFPQQPSEFPRHDVPLDQFLVLTSLVLPLHRGLSTW